MMSRPTEERLRDPGSSGTLCSRLVRKEVSMARPDSSLVIRETLPPDLAAGDKDGRTTGGEESR
jgi:hypothetical protein